MTSSEPHGPERRRHVRVRPAPDYDVTVTFSDDGLVWLPLETVDVSLGGIGVLSTPDLTARGVGREVRLRLALPSADMDVTGVVRHLGGAVCGLEFLPLDEAQTSAMRRVVAELLERGHVA